MKKQSIAVISGKGGVGKTSLTASLVSLASREDSIDPIVLDCDVDAPNLALIMPAPLESDIKTRSTYTTLKAEFLIEKCVHCKKCVDEIFCEFNAIKWNENLEIPILDFLACEGCGACKVLCPEHAFKVLPVKSGEIITYKTKLNKPFVYGKTRLGSTTSGKLVSEIKDHANNLEENDLSNLTIIDGPPGIGCPVIATITGLDYVILITEPTPSGLHDLLRAIEVVQQFKIPFGIVINKHDLKSSFQESFNAFIKDTGYEVIGKIPYDLSIPKAMSFAEAVIDHDPESKASIAINKIYENLKKILWSNTDS
ncbi:MAG: ATP-binding protein [Candidatus Lokiarchaeota archaeon]|nr:ATP-binding protein [Candidatus Lokiarchaeota archaeon]